MDSADEFNLDLQAMAEAGLDRGHVKSKTHPKMQPFIGGIKTPFHIIDLEKSREKTIQALRFIQGLTKEGKKMLVVATTVSLRKLVREFAEKLNLPYVNFRWLGGLLTNFETIKGRIETLKKMEEARTEWSRYTKKERKILEKMLERLEKKFGGLKNLETLPDALFILDTEKDRLAVKEARRRGIKIVAVVDTNSDPSLIDWPIPASNNSLSAVKYILDKVSQAISATRP